MAKQQPVALIKDSHLILSESNEFKVVFKNMSREYFCVIDLYPVIAPMHPHRHPGWFCFGLEGDGIYSFNIIKRDDGLRVESWESRVISSWISDCLEESIMPCSIRVVIRKKLNNEIVFQDRLICYADSSVYEDDRNFFASMENSVDELPLINRIIPQGLNVKIVARNFFDGDAMGYFSWEAYALLNKLHIPADIYVQNCDDKFRPFVHHISGLLSSDTNIDKDTVILYNYSIQDDYLDDILDLPCKKEVYFHGITQPQKLRVFDAELAEECNKGLEELHKLIGFDTVIVNSECTKKHLIEAIKQYENMQVDKEIQAANEMKAKILVAPPVIMSGGAWKNIAADEQFKGSVDKIGDVLLYVGRMYPHKRIEDVLDVFKEVQQQNERAFLLLIGGAHNSYHKYINYKIKQLPPDMQEHIMVIPQVSRNQMKAAYEASTVFITMSEDEGFCVPVLEAMRFHLPVVAKLDKNSAAQEVLGGSGKLVENKDYVSIAREINRIMTDEGYAACMIEQQDTVVQTYADSNLMKMFLNNILECYYGKDLH